MKATIHYILLAFCLFFSLSLKAYSSPDSCKYVIQGKVLDASTQKPIPYATIQIKSSTQGTVADENGNFTIQDICVRECNLSCSCIGYKPVTHHHDDYHEELVIYMAESTSELETVIVEGKVVEGDMQSIALDELNKKDLSLQTTESLGEVLDKIQGVSFMSAGNNVNLPVIHGLYGNRILIVNNGVKHGFQNWGTDHAPEIDISSADNISVLKGAASVRYGPEALGGAVVVNGAPLKLSQAFEGNVQVGYQSNGRGVNSNFGAGQGFNRWSYHVGGSYTKIGDRHAPDYNLSNTGKEEKAFNIGLRYHLPQLDFKVYYSYVDQELGLLRASVFGNGDDFVRALSAAEPLIIWDFSYDLNAPKQNIAHHLLISTVKWHTDLGTLSLQASKQINLREEYDVRRQSNIPIVDLNLETEDIQLEWKHPLLGKVEGGIGLQYFKQDNDNIAGTNTTPLIPNYNTDRLSAFIIESLEKGKNTFELGIRIDHESNSVRGRTVSQDIFRNEYSFSNVTSSFGVIHTLSDNLTLTSNIGSAWRTPNMAELFSFGQHGFRTQFGLWRYYTSEEGKLKTDQVLTEDDNITAPEKGYKWINELDFQKDKQRITLTAYVNYIDNYIFDRPIGISGTVRGPMPVFIFDQADALFAGVDFTYTHPISENIEGTFGASYLWSKNQSKDEPLINQPPANLQYDFSWKPQTPIWVFNSTFKIQANYTFEQFQAPRTILAEDLISGAVTVDTDTEIFDFQDAPDGYFLLNASWNWEVGKLSGQVAAKNLLNTSYRNYLNQMRYFADEMGRNFLFTINYKL